MLLALAELAPLNDIVPLLMLPIALPLASKYRPFSAGYVTNTFFVPALKFTREPLLLDSNIVVRDKVVPEDV
jgi:hypothetical protein